MGKKAEMTPAQAAKVINKSVQFVRLGLQQQRLPFRNSSTKAKWQMELLYHKRFTDMQKKKCRKVGNCMETINELLKRIMELAYEKSTNTNADIFVGYYPHVELVDVRLYLDGWQMNREPDEALGVSMKKKIYKI